MAFFPVSTSTLSAKELGEFIMSQYQLPKKFNCELFRTGMNHTYFLTNGEEKYVLRVYSYNWRSIAEIDEEINLLNTLKVHKLGVSFPIKDKNGTFIQEINAPEGTRYAVLFSFAKGEKVRFMDNETCFSIGAFMAQMHTITLDKTMKRISYDKETLWEIPYQRLTKYFSESLPEMEFIKEIGNSIQNTDFKNSAKGIVHMDIWYDNMAITNDREITLFDFDFCGNGWHVLDIGYFCNQLFHIETDKKEYELKTQGFLAGYQSIRPLSGEQLRLIPKAGLSVFLFYLGVQAQRFDWSNIFLSENYLKMYVGKLKSWIEYYHI
ncbi:phosphotransferase [Maribacter sp. X9]|uniref:phosphotransferase n=1 Tax=Maribacter sp. X9 TaxID=3402159 RepID=UPI003AF3E1BF